MMLQINARLLRLLALVLLLCAALPASTAIAGGEAKTVRVGYVKFENYQEGGDGEYKRGFGYEYLQRIAYSTGWKYEYVYGSFGELFQKLRDGEIDLMGDLTYTQERAQFISYSALPQGRENFYIYTTADQETIDPFDLHTLNGHTIAVTAKSYQHGLLTEWLEAAGYDCEIIESSGSSRMAEELRQGKVDSMVLTDMASTGGYVPIACIGHSEFYIGVNKARPDLLDELNRALREIQATDPYYNEVTYSKYITSSLSNAYLSRQERAWLKAHDNTVHIGYLNGNLPYSDTAADGTPKGLVTVLAHTFEQVFGIHATMTGFDAIEEVIDAANDGRIDLFGPMFSDFWLAEQHGLFNTNAIASTTCLLIYRGDYTPQTTEIIAYAQNSAIQRGAADILFPQGDILRLESRKACLEAVAIGRATCTIVSSATMNLLKQYKVMKSLNMVELPYATTICMSTLHGNSELLNITNRVIFASSKNLTGATLMENADLEIPVSLVSYLEEHALAVILFLVGIIVVMLAAFAVYLRMTTRLARMQSKNEELSQKAYRDELTKLGNRASYLSAENELQLKIAMREPIAFALVVADVNGLKSINDQAGHEAGDLLIQNTSRCLTSVFARSPVFRIGGDEFVVILTGTDYDQRHALLGRLNAQTLSSVSPSQVKNGRTSVAFGLAEYSPETDHTVSEVFGRADKAMYALKKQMKRSRA